MPLPLPTLLPLRAVVITLRLLAPARPRFFHQPALPAFLRHPAGNPSVWDLYLISLDAPASGRLKSRAGDLCRCSVTALKHAGKARNITGVHDGSRIQAIGKWKPRRKARKPERDHDHQDTQRAMTWLERWA